MNQQNQTGNFTQGAILGPLCRFALPVLLALLLQAAYGAAVPAKAVPAAVSAYVSKNFSGSQIVELKKKRYGYKVELSNGTELKLSNDGTPVR